MKKGFTLVELLIVVLIIGILAAIAIPNFRDAQVRARAASSVSNLRVIDDAINQFMFDYGVMLVDGEDFQDAWGKERVDKVFHGVGPFLYPLTSPTPYLSSLVIDPFYTSNLKANHQDVFNLSYDEHDSFYYYHDHDPAENLPDKKRTHLYYQFSGTGYIYMDAGEYLLLGYGPYLEMFEGNAYLSSYPIVYKPTNGIFSRGVLIHHSKEGFL